jgi:hypothetical protein
MTYCDLSDTNVDEEMMASFLPAADKLTTLIVSGCNGLSNGFMRQVQPSTVCFFMHGMGTAWNPMPPLTLAHSAPLSIRLCRFVVALIARSTYAPQWVVERVGILGYLF